MGEEGGIEMGVVKPTTAAAYKLFHEGSLVLAEIEAAGMRIDVPRLDRAIGDTTRQIDELAAELKGGDVWRLWKRRFGEKASMGSRPQLAAVLFGEMGIESKARTSSGHRAKMDEEVLEGIDHPFAKSYLRLEKLKKLRSTYLMGVRREVLDGLLHPSFNLHLVTTYRSSGSDPNFQNIPIRDKEIGRPIRECFIPRDGHVLVECDYSALEFKICACVIGSTSVETIDGPQSIEIVSDRVGRGEDVYVYGYSCEKGRISVSKVLGGGMTRRKAPVWRLVLDNGESIIATGDHQFMQRDGSYVPLSSLKVGDSLMPFYSRIKGGVHGVNYVEVFLNNGERMMAHNLIALDVFGIRIKGSNLLVHHRNGNGTDNSIGNVVVMDRKMHMSIHSKQGWAEEKKQLRVEEIKRRSRLPGVRLQMKKINERRKLEWTEVMWEAWREKLKQSIRLGGGHAGAMNGMYGKLHSEETRRKMSLSRKGKKTGRPGWSKGLTKETNTSVKKISDAKKGKPSYGRGPKKPPVVLECKWCHRLFEVQYLVKKRIRKFCSKSCAMTYRNVCVGNPSKGKATWCKGLKWERATGKVRNPVVSDCDWCGDHFSHYVGDGKRFCSHSCSASNMNRERKCRNHKVMSVEFAGYEDVYNINVGGIHNYVTTAGVVIKNCHWRDEGMVRYASDPAADVHRDMAAACYLLDKDQVTKDVRFFAKNQFVFPQLYGSDYINCTRNLWSVIGTAGLKRADGVDLGSHLASKGIKTMGRCVRDKKPAAGTFERHVQRVERRFNEMFPQWAERKESWTRRYREWGWFPLMTGFRCSGVFSRNQLFNYPIQGPAFHVLLWSLIRLHRWLKRRRMRSRIVGQIHDSIVADVHRDELDEYLAEARRTMALDIRKEWPWIIVPLGVECEVGERNWFDKRKVE